MGWHGRSGHVAANATQSGVDQGHPWKSGGIRTRGERMGWVGTLRLSRLEHCVPVRTMRARRSAAEQLLERSEPEFLAGNRGQHVGLRLGRRPPLQQVGSTERATEGPGMLLGGEVSSSFAPCR